MLGILVDIDQKDSFGDVDKDCALALLGVVLEFIAECLQLINRVVCAWFLGCRRGEDSHSTRGEDGQDPTVAARW